MRPRNADLRRREYLTEAEVERLMEAAQGQPVGLRDSTMVLVAYRHGLRASELVDLRRGIRWTSERPPCTSAGSRRALPGQSNSRRRTAGAAAVWSEQDPKSPFVFTSEPPTITY